MAHLPTGLIVAACLVVALAAATAARAQDARPPELGFLEELYSSGDSFRAETEALRWIQDHPQDPGRPAVELLRAKLYYRGGRYAEADVMLLSLLDRVPRGAVAAEARRLLAFSHVRQGRIAEGRAQLAGADPAVPDLAPLAAPTAAEADQARAVAWSTWLPGSGFFVLDQPVKAATALTLNGVVTAAAVLSYQQGNTPAALLFALVEIALYRGGRDAVREEAERLAGQERRERMGDWLRRAGEPDLLRVGIRIPF